MYRTKFKPIFQKNHSKKKDVEISENKESQPVGKSIPKLTIALFAEMGKIKKDLLKALFIYPEMRRALIFHFEEKTKNEIKNKKNKARLSQVTKTVKRLNREFSLLGEKNDSIKVLDALESAGIEIHLDDLREMINKAGLKKKCGIGMVKIEKIRNEIVSHNFRMIKYVANKYSWKGLDFDDLVQEGTMGLITATDKFEYSRGWKFVTYAFWWINQAISRAIMDQKSLIRIPINQQEIMQKIWRSTEELVQELNREPTSSEIASKAEMKEDAVKKILRIVRKPVKLDDFFSENNKRILNVIPDSNALSPEKALSNKQLAILINQILDSLPPRESHVLRRRNGLFKDYDFDETLGEIGDEHGLTRERVRQIESNALKHLRKNISKRPKFKEAVNSYR